MKHCVRLPACALLLAISAALSSCVSVVQVEGRDLNASRWQEARADLERRVRFELRCESPPTLTLLDSAEMLATSVGVDACGRRTVYTRQVDVYGNPSTWQIDSDGNEADPPTAVIPIPVEAMVCEDAADCPQTLTCSPDPCEPSRRICQTEQMLNAMGCVR